MDFLSKYLEQNQGNLEHSIALLENLHSLNTQQIDKLKTIGIYTIGDLLLFDPIHNAILIYCVANGKLPLDTDYQKLVKTNFTNKTAEELLDDEIIALKGITPTTANCLKVNFFISNIRQLASFPPYLEAKALLKNQDEVFNEPPSAPSELLPKVIGSTYAKMRFNSIIREVDLHDLILTVDHRRSTVSPASSILNLNKESVIYLGYIAGYSQRWINMGTHLGEIIHSIPLAPGESRNISILDWKRKHLTQREEDTSIRETILSTQVHKRALDEVTRAVAEEHQYGKTNTESNTAVTAGSFVAAGAVAGGVAGGIVGGITGGVTGLAVDVALCGADLGAGTVTGTIAGAAGGAIVGSVVGGAAGGLIYSGANAIGMIESGSEGDRDIVGRLQQNILQSTSQKSSAIRSLWSAVVLEDTESEEQEVLTRNITNYNHMHALTIQYYEVLQHYRAEMTFTGATPVIFIPFHPLDFTFYRIEWLWPYLEEKIKELIPKDIIDRAFKDIPEPDFLDITDMSDFDVPFDPSKAKLKKITVKVVTRTPTQVPGFKHCGVKIKYKSGNYVGIDRDDQDSRNGYHVSEDGVKRVDYYTKTFTSCPKLKNIGWIRIQENILRGIYVAVRVFATIVEGSNQAELYSEGKRLGSHTFNISTGNDTKLFSWDADKPLKASWDAYKATTDDYNQLLAENEEERAQYEMAINDRDDARNQLVESVQWKRFYFTQLILNQIDPEELSTMLDEIQIKVENYRISLNTIAHTIPIGSNKNGLLLKLKYLPEELYKNYQSLITIDSSSSSIDKPPPPVYPPELLKLFFYARSIKEWAESNLTKYNAQDDMFLPTSGVFAEAILGKSNSAEKLDMTRFFNWQDSPIPNPAPDILPTDPNQDRHQDRNIDVTMPEGTLNLVNPVNFPDPTSLTEVLKAIQNGNLFRDMSKSTQLADIVSGLTTLAGDMGKAASQMTGEAAVQAMQTAENIGKTAANLSESLFSDSPGSSGSPPKSMTEKGATLNELGKILESRKNKDSKQLSENSGTEGEYSSAPEFIEPIPSSKKELSKGEIERAQVRTMGVQEQETGNADVSAEDQHLDESDIKDKDSQFWEQATGREGHYFSDSLLQYYESEGTTEIGKTSPDSDHIATVFFTTNSSELDQDAMFIPGKIYPFSKSNWRIKIIGSADYRGEESENQQLSELRALAVQSRLEYLIEAGGYDISKISPDQINIQGLGQQPIRKEFSEDRAALIYLEIIPVGNQSQTNVKIESVLEFFRNIENSGDYSEEEKSDATRAICLLSKHKTDLQEYVNAPTEIKSELDLKLLYFRSNKVERLVRDRDSYNREITDSYFKTLIHMYGSPLLRELYEIIILPQPSVQVREKAIAILKLDSRISDGILTAAHRITGLGDSAPGSGWNEAVGNQLAKFIIDKSNEENSTGEYSHFYSCYKEFLHWWHR